MNSYHLIHCLGYMLQYSSTIVCCLCIIKTFYLMSFCKFLLKFVYFQVLPFRKPKKWWRFLVPNPAPVYSTSFAGTDWSIWSGRWNGEASLWIPYFFSFHYYVFLVPAIQNSLCTHTLAGAGDVSHDVWPWPPLLSINQLCHVVIISKFSMRNIFVFLQVHKDFWIILYK